MQEVTFVLVAALAAATLMVPQISGHGMVLDPIARGSRWRCNGKAPRNYDDNGLYCGGYFVQWGTNGGKCGPCGDNYADEMPRMNELGGVYGQGEIVKQYRRGAVIDVRVMITANHMGHFEFNLCDLDGAMGNETDECYGQYPLLDATGNRKWYLKSAAIGEYLVKVQLPAELTCEHCSLQWTYVAGNNWGWCGDGTGALGCGPQETFRTCSDISILDSNDVRLYEGFDYCSRASRSLNAILDDEIPESDVEEQD
uniref:Putative chitin binding domain protein n=1 Tax=Culex tarsalis TaxID=7177 RepID=A0A1Q3FMC2_CULTA